MFAKKLKSAMSSSIATALLAISLGASLGALPTIATASDTISVQMNMARVLRLSAPAATVIIGNPGVADVTIQDPQTLILTGKSYGQTNLIALDSAGNPIADSIVQVQRNGRDIVTIYMGSARTSMACAPECQPTIQVGDDLTFTGNTVGSSDLVARQAQ